MCGRSAEACDMAEGEQGNSSLGFVVGVDVNQHRLAATRTMLRKYGQVRKPLRPPGILRS